MKLETGNLKLGFRTFRQEMAGIRDVLSLVVQLGTLNPELGTSVRKFKEIL